MWEDSMDDLAMAAEDMELRCVLAVVRHGDRTPKQKMKMVVNQARPAPCRLLGSSGCARFVKTTAVRRSVLTGLQLLSASAYP